MTEKTTGENEDLLKQLRSQNNKRANKTKPTKEKGYLGKKSKC